MSFKKPHNDTIKKLPFLTESSSAQGHGMVAMFQAPSFLSPPFRLLLDLNVTIDLEALNVKWLR